VRILLPLLAIASSAASPAVAATVRGGHVVMGTVLEVVVVAAERPVAEALVGEAFAVARHWDDVLTTWRSDGELARLNAAAGIERAISIDLSRALARMRALSAATAGAFDPAVGPLIERSRSPAAGGAADDLPSEALHIRTALDLVVGKARLLAGARIDAGGIGKGIALDAIDARLRGRAAAYYLDFGGSSQLAVGHPEDAATWTVLVTGDSRGEVLGTMTLDGAAISTSRAHPAGADAGAIFDPATRTPVDTPRLATVVAADATTAEAWSTALIVLGPEGLIRARAAGVAALVEDRGTISTTDGFPLRPPRR
jgi:thiamine biosynthesis lipoprotein